jgi:hypothetical protein
VLEAVFILLEPPSSSRRIFIGSHSLPPLWFAVSVLHSPTIVTTKPHELGFRLGLALLTWFLSTRLLNRFLLTRLLDLFPKVLFNLMGFWKSSMG